MTVRIGFATVGEFTARRRRAEGGQLAAAGHRDRAARLPGRTDPAQLQAFLAAPGSEGIVARAAGTGSVLLAFDQLFPRMQEVVDGLVRGDGAELVVVLCGADWTGIASDVLVVNPGRLFPAVVLGTGPRTSPRRHQAGCRADQPGAGALRKSWP